MSEFQSKKDFRDAVWKACEALAADYLDEPLKWDDVGPLVTLLEQVITGETYFGRRVSMRETIKAYFGHSFETKQ